jgi:alpha-1,3-glucosyltransferase
MAVTREEEDANEPGREATWKATLWRTLFLPCHDCIPATKGSREGQGMLETWQWNTVIFSTLLKLSLLPSYHSTDFEVHRNWLAITNTVPISQWYFDQTSQWTLDYPPFFAYFSWILSVPAKLWDSRIVDLKGGLEYDDWKCVLYMRLSVIITEFILAGALFALSRQPSANPSISKVPAVVAAALLLHPGLIIVDHIHFQYNGFLFGILLWSVWAAREVRAISYYSTT